jgi:type III pantothenate kinase
VGRLLLIGNSRWHWAELGAGSGELRCWHSAPASSLDLAEGVTLQAWAAVGALPLQLPFGSSRRIGLEDVPLQGMPPWLGIDRALVGWRAWQQQGSAVLVADAGTALSLTRVSAAGAFTGGLISAGVALQLRALTGSTAQLPAVNVAGAEMGEAWPIHTEAAMAEGCRRGVAAAIAQAWRQACRQSPPASLWLTGGDAPGLMPLLEEQQLKPVLAPDLALEAMAALPAVGMLL